MKRHSPTHSVLKKLIFSPLIITAIFFTAQETKAEGGCPKGKYPSGGGCRLIKCKRNTTDVNFTVASGQPKPYFGGLCNYHGGCSGTYTKPNGVVADPTATATLKKFIQSCPSYAVPRWEGPIVPNNKKAEPKPKKPSTPTPLALECKGPGYYYNVDNNSQTWYKSWRDWRCDKGQTARYVCGHWTKWDTGVYTPTSKGQVENTYCNPQPKP